MRTIDFDFVIPYEIFLKMITHDKHLFRNFHRSYFEYYDAGAQGLGWCWFSLYSKEDRKQYRKYLKQHNIHYRLV